MTPIPPEDKVARALREEFERIGRAREERQRGTPRRRRGRVVAVALALVALLAGAALATRSVFFDAGALHDTRRAPPRSEGRSRQDERLSPLRRADPGGGPPWGARTYTSRLNTPCVVMGRVFEGHVGLVYDGTFHRYGPNVGGTCGAEPNVHLVISTRISALPRPGRTVLYGLVDRAITSMTLTVGGRRRPLSIASDGVFLEVFRGRTALRGATCTYVERGRAHTLKLSR